ncbi:hypothetical protein QQ045_001510 [Rhodiola kirilowii]
MQALHAFFSGLQLPTNISATALILIPKVSNATSISQLRPISLCNFLHKIIARIINSRLTSFLPMIVSEEQAGFIKDRSIHENLGLAHDMVHDLNTKSRGGNVLIKLDMVKAYDKISWSFILAILRKLGFQETWCDLIYRCISNCWYTVRWGGSSYGFFKSYQGVPQCDPLSPSLFIIAMEGFSRSLNASVSRRTILPFNTNCRHVLITHLLYADDLLLFTNGSKRSISNLLQLIEDFSKASGQSLNPSKSLIFFSKLIPPAQKTELLRITRFLEGTFPVFYLGSPLFNGMAKIEYFIYLIDRVRNRVEGWLRNFLSMAGRVTLVNSILSSMSMHCMAILPVPKMVLRRIESIMSNFVWDQGGSKRKHWIGWPQICRSKSMGGLGVHSLEDIALAFKGKLAWNYISSNSLWSRFVHDKFSIGKPGSPIWNSFNHLIAPLRDQSKWIIGKGEVNSQSWCAALGATAPTELAPLPMKAILQNPDHR